MIIVATLATAKVTAGAGAKADQNFKILALLLLCYFWLVIKMWKHENPYFGAVDNMVKHRATCWEEKEVKMEEDFHNV